MTTKRGSELVEGALALVAAGAVAAVGFLLRRRKAVVSLADTQVTRRLQKHAATLGDDPEYKQWAATMRAAAMQGLSSDEKIGKDELLRRKAALRKSS